MNNVKKGFYDILSTLEYSVYQNRPEIITEFPSITFLVVQHQVNATLDKEIGYQQVLFNVDIFANTGAEASQILAEVESLLRQNGYLMTDCFDVAEPDNRSHLAVRFIFKI